MNNLADILREGMRLRVASMPQPDSQPEPEAMAMAKSKAKAREIADYRRRKKAWRYSDNANADEQGFVKFPPIAACLPMQSQYACRYADGQLGYPNLGAGLRFSGDNDMGYWLKIHKNDVDKFLSRVRRYLRQQGRL